jgi:hypothetical protein
VLEISDRLLKGHSRAEMIEYAKNEWGVLAPTVDMYIGKARDAIVAHFQLQIEYIFAESMARLEANYRREFEENENPQGSIAIVGMKWKIATDMLDRHARKAGAIGSKDNFTLELPNFEENS